MWTLAWRSIFTWQPGSREISRCGSHARELPYEAAGFRMAEDQIEVPFKYGENRKAGSYMAHFRKEEAHGSPLHLKIYWTWNADNRWEC